MVPPSPLYTSTALALIGMTLTTASAFQPSHAFVNPTRSMATAPRHGREDSMSALLSLSWRSSSKSQPFLFSSQQHEQQRSLLSTTTSTSLFATTEETEEKQVVVNSEIERLRSMAAKLRAEASALEALQAMEFANAAERAFKKFDTDADGQITVAELKAGLEKMLKTELPEDRIQQLMAKFDTSGDGALQLDEFVGVDRFRSQLDAFRAEEKRASLEASKVAQLEAEAAKFALAKYEILNDRPPSTADKLISVLPYLFPLLDGLQFGRFLFLENQDNPILQVVAVLFALYRSIPFGGFIAFFALNFLAANPTINRLIRFNMQQAIYLDIALFFPGLIAALYTLVFSNLLGVQIPPAFTEISTNAIFLGMLGAVAYASISSLLGITPDKIPFISQAVNDRMPTLDMFDDQGRFIPRQKREEEEKRDEEEKKRKDDDNASKK